MADIQLSYGTFSLQITTPDILPDEHASPAVQQGALEAQTQQAKDLINAALDAFALACEIDAIASELTDPDQDPDSDPDTDPDDRPALRIA